MSTAAMLYFSCHVYEAPCPESGTLTDSCLKDKSSSSSSTDTFTDTRDNKSYKFVKIGAKTWMTKNLEFNAKDSKCYENLNGHCATYGRLYNWATATTACPEGWRLPSQNEWVEMYNYVWSDKNCKDCDAKHLKATSANGLDSYGFSALLGGMGLSDGTFSDVGVEGYWWSKTKFDDSMAFGRNMSYDYDYAGWENENMSYFFSVRCIKD